MFPNVVRKKLHSMNDLGSGHHLEHRNVETVDRCTKTARSKMENARFEACSLPRATNEHTAAFKKSPAISAQRRCQVHANRKNCKHSMPSKIDKRIKTSEQLSHKKRLLWKKSRRVHSSCFVIVRAIL